MKPIVQCPRSGKLELVTVPCIEASHGASRTPFASTESALSGHEVELG